MAYAHAALDPERLPWLTDERRPPKRRSETPMLLTWGLAATALIAGASFWIGARDSGQPEPAAPPVATVVLPETAPEQPAPVAKTVMPQVEPVAEPREVKVAPRRQVRARRKLSPMERDEALPAVVASQQSAKTEEGEEKKPDSSVASPEKLTYWPASESEGAEGKVVRIGTFASRYQAKRAWWKVVKAYPGMKSLKAVVAPVPSMRNGRTYFRLQFGTTSQAHSEILCQRMRMIRVSCAVVGLQESGGAA